MNNTLRTDIHPAARRHLPIVGNSHLCGNVPIVLIVELAYHHRVGNNNAGSIGTGTKQSQRMSGLNDQCLLRSKFFEILLDQKVLHPVLTNLSGFTISNKLIGIQRDIKTEIVVNHYLKGFAFHTFATIFINRSGFQIACGTEAVSVNSPTGTQFFHKFRCQLLMQFQGDIAQCILQCRSCLRRRKRITTVGGPPDTFYESWVGR